MQKDELLSQCSDISYMSEIDDDLPQSINVDFSNGSPLKNDDFLIVHYNINSIRAEDRVDQLTDVCQKMKIDCLILTETKIDATIPSNLLQIPGTTNQLDTIVTCMEAELLFMFLNS